VRTPVQGSVDGGVSASFWREADHRGALALLAAALPGLWAGAEVLQVMDPSYVQLGIGVLVVVVVAALLLGRDVRLPGAKTRWGPVLVGSVSGALVSGALASSTGLSGPPAALLLASRGLRKRPFRATISFYFLGLDIALLAVLALRGLVDAGGLAPLALVLMAATHVGKALGTKLFGGGDSKAPGLTIDQIVVPRQTGAHTPNGVSLYARWLFSQVFGVGQSEGPEPSSVRAPTL
jgi:uncharacterized membrane protein YfcA